jgi:hypothetical protein
VHSLEVEEAKVPLEDDGSCSIFLKSTNRKKPMKSMSH